MDDETQSKQGNQTLKCSVDWARHCHLLGWHGKDLAHAVYYELAWPLKSIFADDWEPWAPRSTMIKGLAQVLEIFYTPDMWMATHAVLSLDVSAWTMASYGLHWRGFLVIICDVILCLDLARRHTSLPQKDPPMHNWISSTTLSK